MALINMICFLKKSIWISWIQMCIRDRVIIDRETVIEEDHIDEIIDSGVQNILVHKEEANSSDYSIIFKMCIRDRY